MRVVVSLVLVALASAGNNTLVRYELSASTGARCLDGSPAVYYFAPGEAASATKWIVSFEGGGWCYNEVDCYYRSLGRRGSSTSYPPTDEPLAAVLSGSCDVNREFCDYNRIWVPSCDGNSFSGNREDPVIVRGTPLYFRGHRILRAVLDALVASHRPTDNLSLPSLPPSLSVSLSLCMCACLSLSLSLSLFCLFLSLSLSLDVFLSLSFSVSPSLSVSLSFLSLSLSLSFPVSPCLSLSLSLCVCACVCVCVTSVFVRLVCMCESVCLFVYFF